MKTFKHILVPTDFSETARDALRTARELATDTQARLTIAHVVPDVWQQAWVDVAGIDIQGVQRAWEDGGKNRMRALVDNEGLAGAGVSTVVLIGTPHLAIVEYADSHEVDLMVVGTHGHGPIRRFMIGSVAERLIRAAHCPVLSVPHDSLRAKEAVAVTPALSKEPHTTSAESTSDSR